MDSWEFIFLLRERVFVTEIDCLLFFVEQNKKLKYTFYEYAFITFLSNILKWYDVKVPVSIMEIFHSVHQVHSGLAEMKNATLNAS